MPVETPIHSEIVGSVRANGKVEDSTNAGWGNVELAVFDLNSGDTRVVVLHKGLEQDDHDGPGLLVLADGRYLAAYSRHNREPRIDGAALPHGQGGMYHRFHYARWDGNVWIEHEIADAGSRLRHQEDSGSS